MVKKTDKIEIRISSKDKTKVQEEAAFLGFINPSGNLNLSRFLRWIIREGNRPIDRSQYDELIRLNQNLIKLGGLTNQYLYHLNRERKILLEKDIEDNNKKYLTSLDQQNEKLDEIKSLLCELKKVSEKIYFLENA